MSAPAFWLDAQLPPALAPWLTERFGVPAYSAACLGFRDTDDEVIFQAAREAGAVIVSKDSDFLECILRVGPPRLLYVTCGNTSKARLAEMFDLHFAEAHRLFGAGEVIVELS